MNGHPYPTHQYWSPDQIGRQSSNASVQWQSSAPPPAPAQGQHQYQPQQHPPQHPPLSSQTYPMQQFLQSPSQQNRKESTGGSRLRTFNIFSSKPSYQAGTTPAYGNSTVYSAPQQYPQQGQAGIGLQQQAPPAPPLPHAPLPRPPQTPLPQQQLVRNPQFPQRHPSQQQQQNTPMRLPSQVYQGPQQPQPPRLQNYQQPNPSPQSHPSLTQFQRSATPSYTQLPARPPVEIPANAPPQTPRPSTSPPHSDTAPVELYASPIVKTQTPPSPSPSPTLTPLPSPPPPPPPKIHFDGSMNTTTITTVKTTTTVINTAPGHRNSIGIPMFPGAYPEEPEEAPSPPLLPPPTPQQQPVSQQGLGLKIKIPETPISANVASKARGSADVFWGYLFDESSSPPDAKPILKEFFEQLAGYMITTWEKQQTAVVSPDSMAMYYASLTERGSSRLDFFVSASTSPSPIIALYQITGCQYLLIPPRYKPPADGAPRVGGKKLFMQPGLTAAGFVQWMTINTLVDPQREFNRLNRLLQTAVIPRKDPTAPSFPDILPRGALPEAPNDSVLEKWGAVFHDFRVGNKEITNRIHRNLQDGIEGGVGHMGPRMAGAGGEKGEEIKVLREEMEALKKAMWDRDQELKRCRVQISQLQQREQQFQHQQAREAELRRRQSTSSTISAVSSLSTVHPRPDFSYLFTPESSIREGSRRPSPAPTPMPEPYIPGYDTPDLRDGNRLSLIHRQTMPNLPTGMTPAPQPLPRHNSMGSIDTLRVGSAIGGFKPFQPITPVQSPAIDIGGGNGYGYGGGGIVGSAAEQRRSSSAASREGLPASLCISPMQEYQGGGWGKNSTLPPVVPEKFKRNDEFAMILGTDV